MIPNMRPDGTLPPGRWGTTLPDVETTFVSGRDPVRAEIMQDFINALQLLRRVTPVSRVWIGGYCFCKVNGISLVEFKHGNIGVNSSVQINFA